VLITFNHHCETDHHTLSSSDNDIMKAIAMPVRLSLEFLIQLF